MKGHALALLSLLLSLGCQSARTSDPAPGAGPSQSFGAAASQSAVGRPLEQQRARRSRGPALAPALRRDALRKLGALVKDGGELSPDGLETSPMADLDRDGREEVLAYHWGLCGASGNCAMVLYLSGGGYHFGGNIDGVETEKMPRPNGPHDIWAFWRAGCAGGEGTATVYRFRRGAYRVQREVLCPCPGESGAATDALCAKRLD